MPMFDMNWWNQSGQQPYQASDRDPNTPNTQTDPQTGQPYVSATDPLGQVQQQLSGIGSGSQPDADGNVTIDGQKYDKYGQQVTDNMPATPYGMPATSTMPPPSAPPAAGNAAANPQTSTASGPYQNAGEAAVGGKTGGWGGGADSAWINQIDPRWAALMKNDRAAMDKMGLGPNQAGFDDMPTFVKNPQSEADWQKRALWLGDNQPGARGNQGVPSQYDPYNLKKYGVDYRDMNPNVYGNAASGVQNYGGQQGFNELTKPEGDNKALFDKYGYQQANTKPLATYWEALSEAYRLSATRKDMMFQPKPNSDGTWDVMARGLTPQTQMGYGFTPPAQRPPQPQQAAPAQHQAAASNSTGTRGMPAPSNQQARPAQAATTPAAPTWQYPVLPNSNVGVGTLSKDGRYYWTGMDWLPVGVSHGGEDPNAGAPTNNPGGAGRSNSPRPVAQ